MRPVLTKAYELLEAGAIALAQVESNGMRVDLGRVKKSQRKAIRKAEYLEEKIMDSYEGKVWRKKYRRKMNLLSNHQLADILFNELKYTATVFTDTGAPSVNVEALEEINADFIQDYVRMKKFLKAEGTYLQGVLRENVNSYIYPFFNLHNVRTYRSSSSAPNFQNIPVRDAEIKKLVRSCFLARPGRRIVESDFSGIEVGIAACYHKDPVMLEYISDKSKDMHRDMAMQCYMLTEKEVNKEIRYCGKNKFVFPQFYGDFYPRCARALWDAIGRLDLKTDAGVPLYEHLKAKGITKLGKCDVKEKPQAGTFEYHIKQVEDDFWGNRFKEYKKWKNRWYEQYIQNGYIDSKTGFRCSGWMKRNEVVNYPVQGAAFHCLLWSLVELQKEIQRKGMKTLLIGQIHDSIVADVPDEELGRYIRVVKRVTMKKLLQQYSWICVPLEIEIEATPVNGSWLEKTEKFSI